MQTQVLHMSSPIDALHGVGPETMKVFKQAGLKTIGDIYGTTCGQPLQLALKQLQDEDTVFHGNEAHWRGLATRVDTVVARVRSNWARPYEPDHFCCPITHQLMTDPVLSKYGDTYERAAILRLVMEHGVDIYRRALTDLEVFPNRGLLQAIAYYRENELRFAIPLNLML